MEDITYPKQILHLRRSIGRRRPRWLLRDC